MWSGFNVWEIGKEGKRGRGWLRFGIDGGSGGCEVKRSQEKVKRVELGFTCSLLRFWKQIRSSVSVRE